MRVAILVLSAAIAASMAATTATGASLPPPVAQASEGKMECYSPDVVRKTCHSISGYKPGPNGEIENSATVLVSATPLVTMEAVATVRIVDGQVCGQLAPEDLAKASFSVDGGPAADAQAAMLREKLAGALKDIFGKQLCTAYVTDGDGLIAKESIDGAAQPREQKVIWISPSDGFEVRP